MAVISDLLRELTVSSTNYRTFGRYRADRQRSLISVKRSGSRTSSFGSRRLGSLTGGADASAAHSGATTARGEGAFGFRSAALAAGGPTGHWHCARQRHGPHRRQCSGDRLGWCGYSIRWHYVRRQVASAARCAPAFVPMCRLWRKRKRRRLRQRGSASAPIEIRLAGAAQRAVRASAVPA